MPEGNGRSGTALFCKNLVPICTHDRRLWIWIYPWISMDITIDIHEKSVDMDMDGRFHIHCKPAYASHVATIWNPYGIVICIPHPSPYVFHMVSHMDALWAPYSIAIGVTLAIPENHRLP